MAIPHNITLVHCLRAIEDIDKNGVEPQQKADYYHLYYGDKRYPPKVVLRRANKYANGEELWSHHGGAYTNDFLTSRGFTIGKIDQSEYPFFTKGEIEKYAEIYSTKSYNNKNLFSLYGRFLKNTIFYKTIHWSNQIDLQGFAAIADRRWTKGYGRIIHYSWARIFKKNDINKKIFFTVGADASYNALIYKLDCMDTSQANSLNAEQIQIFNDYVKVKMGVEWQIISSNKMVEYNWDKLIRETRNFILRHRKVYEEVNKIIFKNKKIISIPNLLVKKEPDALKQSKQFRGRDIDFDSLNHKKKLYGKIGEELVKKYEKKYLLSKGRKDLAEKVKKVKDGNGYDILSFDYKTDEEKYIEVKSTVSNFNEPFLFTDNEYKRYRVDEDKYFIYRVYNLDINQKTGFFYEIYKTLEKKFSKNTSVYKFTPIVKIKSKKI